MGGLYKGLILVRVYTLNSYTDLYDYERTNVLCIVWDWRFIRIKAL